MERYLEFAQDDDNAQLEQLKADARRKVVVPSQADTDAAQTAFKSVVAQWAAANPRNRELLLKAESEIAKLRASR